MSLEFATNQELIDELRKRSSLFFCTMRPLAPIEGGGEWWVWWGPEGGTTQLLTVLGQVQVATFSLLHPQEEDT